MKTVKKRPQQPGPPEYPQVPKPGETALPHPPDLKPAPDTPTVRPDAQPGKLQRPEELPDTE